MECNVNAETRTRFRNPDSSVVCRSQGVETGPGLFSITVPPVGAHDTVSEMGTSADYAFEHHASASLMCSQQTASALSLSQSASRPCLHNIDPTTLPLPAGWEAAETSEGYSYFVDHKNERCVWQDPRLQPGFLDKYFNEQLQRQQLPRQQQKQQQLKQQEHATQQQLLDRRQSIASNHSWTSSTTMFAHVTDVHSSIFERCASTESIISFDNVAQRGVPSVHPDPLLDSLDEEGDCLFSLPTFSSTPKMYSHRLRTVSDSELATGHVYGDRRNSLPLPFDLAELDLDLSDNLLSRDFDIDSLFSDL